MYVFLYYFGFFLFPFPSLPHASSVFVQKKAGFPQAPAKHGWSSCSKIKHLLLY